MSSFYAIEQGSDTIIAKADTETELVNLVGPRAESLNKTYTILAPIGSVVPVKSYEYKQVEAVVEPTADATEVENPAQADGKTWADKTV